jgi:hypothetical protein
MPKDPSTGNNLHLVITTLEGSQVGLIVLDRACAPAGVGTFSGLVTLGENIYFVDDDPDTPNPFQ